MSSVEEKKSENVYLMFHLECGVSCQLSALTAGALGFHQASIVVVSQIPEQDLYISDLNTASSACLIALKELKARNSWASQGKIYILIQKANREQGTSGLTFVSCPPDATKGPAELVDRANSAFSVWPVRVRSGTDNRFQSFCTHPALLSPGSVGGRLNDALTTCADRLWTFHTNIGNVLHKQSVTLSLLIYSHSRNLMQQLQLSFLLRKGSAFGLETV
jgi:hypothetical protein